MNYNSQYIIYISFNLLFALEIFGFFLPFYFLFVALGFPF